MCALSGWAAFAEPVRRAAAVGGLCLVAFVGQWLAITDEPGWAAWIAGTVFTAVACALARRQQILLEQLREAQAGLAAARRRRGAQPDRARAARRDRARADRVAAAHHLGPAGAGRGPGRGGERARRGRATFTAEPRRRPRRRGSDEGPAPATRRCPGSSRSTSWSTSFRRAGTDVTCEVSGDLSQLTATEGLTVYRILQEALTNVARHAPGSPATVHLQVEDGQTRVQVDSAGRPGRPSHDGAGLAGMRERAEALGGRLTAGPSGNGWRVEAVLPA